MEIVTERWPYLFPAHERSVIVAYALWLLGGMAGIHKLYLGRPVMTVVYFLTSGLLGIGWLVDLFTLPRQVERCRWRQFLQREREGRAAWVHSARGARPLRWPPRKPEEIMLTLLQAASRHGGSLSVTEGVMATGLPFRRVERALQEMLASGYVDVGNDPESGVVRYRFPELHTNPQ